MGEGFGVKLIAAERERRSENGAFAEGETVGLTDFQCGSKNSKVHILDGKSGPGFDESYCKLVGKRVFSAAACGLGLELPQNLDR